MSESTQTGDLVIRPSTAHYKKMLRTTPLFLLIFAVIMVARNGLPGLVIGAITAAITLGLVAIYFKRARIIVTPTTLTRIRLTGIPKRWDRSEVATLVRANMPVAALDTRILDNLFVLDRVGSTMVRLKSSHWSEQDITRLAEALGLVPEGPPSDMAVKPSALAERYPNAVPFYERRPWLFSFGLIAALIVVIVVISLLAAALLSS